MTKIALFGAAGAIGRSIASALRQAETPYRVVGRSLAALQKEFGADPLAEAVSWNPDDPDSVRAAIDVLADKIDRQIKKHKEKLTDHHRSDKAAGTPS